MRNAERTTQRAPWWQTTRTPWRGFALAAAFLVLGSILIADAGGRPDAVLLRLSAGALFLLIGIVHLVSAIAMRLRRHDHAGSAADRHATTVP